MKAFVDHGGGTSARARILAAGARFTVNQKVARSARLEAKKRAWRKEALEARRAYEVARVAAMERAAYIAERVYRALEARPRMHDILAAVSERTGVRREDILSHRRKHEFVVARHECFWLSKQKTTKSLAQIGRFFGGRDHTTVIHGIEAHERRRAKATIS